MGKKSQQGNVLELVIIGVLVLAIAGLLAWRFLGTTDSTTQNSSTKTATDSLAADSQATETKYFVVSEWGVRFALSDKVKAISYRYDTSRAFFPGDMVQVASVTDVSGKLYSLINTKSGENGVDAICSTYGVARSLEQNQINSTTGVPYSRVAQVGDYYYYAINGVSGSTCGQSDAATSAVNDAMSVLSKPLTNSNN